MLIFAAMIDIFAEKIKNDGETDFNSIVFYYLRSDTVDPLITVETCGEKKYT